MTGVHRLLSGVQITSAQAIEEAIGTLHKEYQVPHIVVTSIRDPTTPGLISIIGSTARSDFSPRIFKISVSSIDCYFSGTGDMFAGLTVVRLREAVIRSHLLAKKGWVSPDDVPATSLPLAQATEKVLESLQAVLEKTKHARDEELERLGGPMGVLEKERDSEKKLRLRTSKAAEVRVVRCLNDLRSPVGQFKAVSLEDKGPGEDDKETAGTLPETMP